MSKTFKKFNVTLNTKETRIGTVENHMTLQAFYEKHWPRRNSIYISDYFAIPFHAVSMIEGIDE